MVVITNEDDCSLPFEYKTSQDKMVTSNVSDFDSVTLTGRKSLHLYIVRHLSPVCPRLDS